MADSDVSLKISYSVSVTGSIKNKLNKEILNAVESDKGLRKEIARIFQQANRRIQNVEKTGLYSPAVAALNKQGVKGYSKFSMKNFSSPSSWTALKEEYAKAVAFLNQPTSTATGTRQYNKALQQRYGLTDEEYRLLSDSFTGKLDSLSESDYVERYLMRYKDFSGDFEAAFKSSSSQMEEEAKQLENALQESIDTQSEEVATNLDAEIKALLEGFSI